MGEMKWIRIDQFCRLHNVEPGVIGELRKYELIQVTVHEETEYLTEKELKKAQAVIGMYYDLNVNPEGIDIILRLLRKLKKQDRKLTDLSNRLRMYENM